MTLLEALTAYVTAYKGESKIPDICSIYARKETDIDKCLDPFLKIHRNIGESAFEFLLRVTDYMKTHEYNSAPGSGYQGCEGDFARYKNCVIAKCAIMTWRKLPGYIGSACISILLKMKNNGRDFEEVWPYCGAKMDADSPDSPA